MMTMESQTMSNAIKHTGRQTMEKWEYKSLQFKTVPSFGAWSRISENDLDILEKVQNDEWEIFQMVNIRGSLGFTAHVLFLLRRRLQ